jgi:hypothetical protein
MTPEDLSSKGSPRSKVTRQFQGLRLNEEEYIECVRLESSPENSGGYFNGRIAKPGLSGDDGAAVKDSDSSTTRGVSGGEQSNTISLNLDVPEKQHYFEFSGNQGSTGTQGVSIDSSRTESSMENEDRPTDSEGKLLWVLPNRAKTSSPLSHSSPGPTGGSKQQQSSKSRSKSSRKRSGTPPPSRFSSSERPVIDHERASQTWQEAEITGYTMSDPDDDGEGINGVGFRPTAAMAQVRAEKRRAQVLEYKNREAREARARRSERRREGPTRRAVEEVDEGENSRRKVRFEGSQEERE